MNIQCIRSGMTNCWLVRWSGRTILIDAGSAADRSFAARLARIIDPRMIELLVLTNGHADHVGHAYLSHYPPPICRWCRQPLSVSRLHAARWAD